MGEHTSLIEIDEAKFVEHFGENPSVTKVENSIGKMLTGGDDGPRSRDEIAVMLGSDDDGAYEKYADADSYAEIEEQCERHPDEWFAISPASMARCWRCRANVS